VSAQPCSSPTATACPAQVADRPCQVSAFHVTGREHVAGVRDLAGLSEVRVVLESHAARLAAERATEADRAEIAALLDELEQAEGEHGERTLIDLDQRIHRHVYRCTHNPFLEATLNEYYVLTLRIWFLVLDKVVRLGDAIQEHRDLLEAINARDPDRAADVMRLHIEGFEQAIRRVL